jgi:hypothetical protein
MDKLPEEVKEAHIKSAINEAWLALSAVVTMVIMMLPFIN